MSASIGPLLRKLQKLAPLTSKGTSDLISEVLDDLEPVAVAHGLDAGQIEKAWAIALGGHLASSSALRLLSIVLPTTAIASGPILFLVSHLGQAAHLKPVHHGRVEYKVQKKALELVLAWVQLGATGTEARDALEAYCGILERGLDYAALRDPTAQLLLLITRRHHIQAYRIQHLQSVITKTAPTTPPSLHHLLALYKSFYPEHVFASTSTSTSASTKIRKSKASLEYAEDLERVFGRVDADAERGGGGGERDSKRRKVGIAIPSGVTYTAGTTSTPLSDITSLAALARTVDKLDMPSMAGSVLGAVPGAGREKRVGSGEDQRAKVWAILLRAGFGGDPNYINRLSFFVTSALAQQLSLDDIDGSAQEGLEDLLCRVRELCAVAGELTETIEEFLVEFLKTWDGDSMKEVVFDLIALVRPVRFSVLDESYLVPLQALAVSGSSTWLADLMRCLEELVRNWALRDYSESTTAFGEDGLDWNEGVEALQSLVCYGDRIASAGIQAHPDSVTFRSAALSFYETSLLLPLSYDLPVVIIPSPVFTYSCLLSLELMSVSRICGIISQLREALTGEKTAIEKTDESNLALVSVLNAYLVDFINALWQRRLMSDQAGATAMGLDAKQVEDMKAVCGDRGQDWVNGLGLTVHPALAIMARDCLSKLEADAGTIITPPNAGPVLPGTLKDLAHRGGPKVTYNDFRVVFLERLQEQGAEGIHQFFFTSLQSLINRRASLPRTPT